MCLREKQLRSKVIRQLNSSGWWGSQLTAVIPFLQVYMFCCWTLELSFSRSIIHYRSYKWRSWISLSIALEVKRQLLHFCSVWEENKVMKFRMMSQSQNELEELDLAWFVGCYTQSLSLPIHLGTFRGTTRDRVGWQKCHDLSFQLILSWTP